MSARESTARAWLELMRVSNLPTCISNVLVGLAIGGWIGGWPPGAALPLLLGSIGLLYVSGMALNDVVDAPIDAAQRPDRPIPSNRVSRRAALAFAVAALAGGLALLAPLGWKTLAWGGALAAAIVLYDLVHKKVAAAVLLMGACRGLVYVVAASAVAASLDWTRLGAIAGAMAAYVVALTLLARREHRAAVRRTVMGLLAGISLIDACFLILLGAPGLAGAAVACYLLTLLGHSRIAGT